MSFELEDYKRRATRPLAKAILDGDLEEVKTLSKKFRNLGYGPDQMIYAYRSHAEAVHPLLLSIMTNNFEIFQYLVEEQKATIDAKIPGLNGLDGNDMTLLHFACLNSSRLQFVRYLLEKGAKVDAEDKWGWTPLHLASLKGHKEIVMNLLVEHADVRVVDADGESPLDKALRGGHQDLLSLLGIQGGDANTLMSQKKNTVENFSLKFTVLGSEAVGKTSILNRFLLNSFDESILPTFGAVSTKKHLKLGSNQYDLTFWDVGGHRRYRHISPIYYRNASVVLIVYDVTNRDSYLAAQSWVIELMSVCHHQTTIALCGNKVDLKENRVVSTEEAHRYADSLSVLYVEASARTGRCVYDLVVCSLKVFGQIVGRFAKTSEAPVMAKKEQKTIKSHLCTYYDLRTGKSTLNVYKHANQLLKPSVKTGFLLKEGHFIPNWKRRWFVLKGEALYYYRDRSQLFPAGAISIRDATITIADASPHRHSFQILTRPLNSAMHQRYVIAAESEAEMKEWISAIEQERVRYMHERESINYNIDGDIPIPADPYPFPVVVECEEKVLNFYKDGFSLTRYPLATYPLNKPVFVRKDEHNPSIFYLSDDDSFLLRLQDQNSSTADPAATTVRPSKNQLVDFLRASLPSSSIFTDMYPEDYISAFFTAYEYACHRLRIPLIQPLVQQLAAMKRSRERINCLSLCGILLSSQDVEAIFYALKWYPFCDELNFSNTQIDAGGLMVLVEEVNANSNLKSLDLSGNSFGDSAAPYLVALLKTEIEQLNLRATDIKSYAIGPILDTLATEGASKISDINLSNCELGDSITDSLSRVLNTNTKIHSLDLRENRLTGYTGRAILSALMKNHTIRYIDLKENQLEEALERNISQLVKRNQAKDAHLTLKNTEFVVL